MFIAQNLWDTQIRSYRYVKGVPKSLPWIQKVPDYQTEVKDSTEEEEKIVAGTLKFK